MKKHSTLKREGTKKKHSKRTIEGKRKKWNPPFGCRVENDVKRNEKSEEREASVDTGICVVEAGVRDLNLDLGA